MTRVLVDTNVANSALLFPNSTPAHTLALMLTDVIVDERRAVIGRKRPDLLPQLETFLAGIDDELAHHADSPVPISDPNDQPILDAALASAVDVIVTGDKAFLSLTLAQPRIITARAFLDAYPGNA